MAISRISRALQQMSNETIIDKKVLKNFLNEIARALLQSEVQFKLVCDMQTTIKKLVGGLSAGHNKFKIIEQAVFYELCKILDPGEPSFTPKKETTNVVLVVGLQGSGQTTTCKKYAFYHQSKGYKPALVCVDTLCTGSFDQLKQNATETKIPFYGSYTESDPVRIVVEGVMRFKKENCNLIIVDTGERHKQEATLFEEMHHVSEAMKPDVVIFVMDSSIGQAAFDQVQAFKQFFPAGAVILTKMDGHAKGFGALSAVAATKTPVMFIGSGEHMDEFEVFDVKPFVSRLLGFPLREGGETALIFCYSCNRHVTVVTLASPTDKLTCSVCRGGFLEESDSAPSDRSFVQPWVPYSDLNMRLIDLSWNQRNAFAFALTNYIINSQLTKEQKKKRNKKKMYVSTPEPGYFPFRLGTNMGSYFIAHSLSIMMSQLRVDDGTPRAATKVVEKLPDVKITREMVSLVCTVCRESFDLVDEAKRMPCNHLFHKYCLLPWLELRNSCPLCRAELPTDDYLYEYRKWINRTPSEASGSGIGGNEGSDEENGSDEEITG